MSTTYEKDIIVWSTEQAALLRAGKLSALDIEHIAEEIEDVGQSEKRELSSRMAVLLSHLLKWEYQADRRNKSWTSTIGDQRKRIVLALKATPSLRASLTDADWLEEAWLDARSQARTETGLDNFPDSCLWSMNQILSVSYLPVGATVVDELAVKTPNNRV